MGEIGWCVREEKQIQGEVLASSHRRRKNVCPTWVRVLSQYGWKCCVGERGLSLGLVPFGFLLGVLKGWRSTETQEGVQHSDPKTGTMQGSAAILVSAISVSEFSLFCFFLLFVVHCQLILLNVSVLGDFPPIRWNSCTRHPVWAMAWVPVLVHGDQAARPQDSLALGFQWINPKGFVH